MKRKRYSGNRGNATIEMGMIFLPLVLLSLGLIEVGRGMWMYHTLTTAIKTGARYATVHGQACLQSNASCPATASAVAAVIRTAGVGLDANRLQLTLISGSSYSCGTLAACTSDSTQWPSSSGNRPGSSITIQGAYNFQSVLATFWPGQGSASLNYTAAATEVIEF